MSYTLKMRGIVVGWSELERGDAGARVATGVLRPGHGYELVEPIFRLYAEAVPRGADAPRDPETLARYEAARERLALELFDARGRAVPAERLHVTDYASPDGSPELEVITDDARFWAEWHPCA